VVVERSDTTVCNPHPSSKPEGWQRRDGGKSGWHPSRDADFPAFTFGGVAALNHRLQALIPAGMIGRWLVSRFGCHTHFPRTRWSAGVSDDSSVPIPPSECSPVETATNCLPIIRAGTEANSLLQPPRCLLGYGDHSIYLHRASAWQRNSVKICTLTPIFHGERGEEEESKV